MPLEVRGSGGKIGGWAELCGTRVGLL